MSVRVMSLVWDGFPRGGSDKLAMLAMADWCNDLGGSLYPSISAIAKKIGRTEKQARVIIHRLIDEGWIEVVGNEFGGDPGRSRRYQLIVEKLRPPAGVTPPAVVRDPSRSGSPTPPVGVSQSTNEPSGSAIKTPRDEFDARSFLLKAGVSVRIADDWLSLCETRKVSITRADLVSIDREADRAGVTLGYALGERCLPCGWTDFKAEWDV